MKSKMSSKSAKPETTHQPSTEIISFDVALERLSQFSECFTENTVYDAIQRKNSIRNRDEIPTVLEASKRLSRLNSKIQKNIKNLREKKKKRHR